MRKTSNSCNYNTFLYIFNSIICAGDCKFATELVPKVCRSLKKLRRIVAVLSFR